MIRHYISNAIFKIVSFVGVIFLTIVGFALTPLYGAFVLAMFFYSLPTELKAGQIWKSATTQELFKVVEVANGWFALSTEQDKDIAALPLSLWRKKLWKDHLYEVKRYEVKS